MRIGIDCRLSGIEHAGIGRYIEELVRELIKQEDIHWVLFFQKPNQLPWLKDRPNITSIVAEISHYTLAEQTQLPSVFEAAKLDLLHVPHFNVPVLYKGKFVVTIHDLLWHDQRGRNITTLSPLMYALKYRAYRFVSNQAIKRAIKVIVPAQTVKKLVLSHVPSIKSQKIVVTYEGVDQKWFEVCKKRPTEKILFYTGSLYPHKNVMLIVRALQNLPEYKLYISSSRNVFVDKFMEEVAHLGLKNRVIHLGRLSDAELKTWYQKSFALVQPSLSEGFGLTGIEAFAAGLPVLASDIPIFREVYGACAVYFDPIYDDAFVSAVKVLETKNREQIVELGLKQAGKYSWEKMAQSTLSVYRQALS